jgi:hypothetical protein
MAGPGGSHLKRKIDEAIADGRLPKDFRGEAGSHLRKEMIRNLVEAGQRVYPCAASNYCWFRPESALCTQGDHPLLKRCNPGACANSIVTLEHKPHGCGSHAGQISGNLIEHAAEVFVQNMGETGWPRR